MPLQAVTIAKIETSGLYLPQRGVWSYGYVACAHWDRDAHIGSAVGGLAGSEFLFAAAGSTLDGTRGLGEGATSLRSTLTGSSAADALGSGAMTPRA